MRFGLEGSVRQRLRKDAETAPETDEPGEAWEETMAGLEAATCVLVKKVSAEWSLEARGRDSLRIQQVVEDLEGVCRELEAKDED